MRTCIFATIFLVLTSVILQAAELPVMPVDLILEERRYDEDLSVVIPDRLEMYCELSDQHEKSNAFAGFETKWQGPIEFEVTGSGKYEQLGAFSTVAISFDYGGKNGWIERSFVGLGLIPKTRGLHRPAWGVTEHGKSIMRGNVINAKPEPQRIVIDPAKYAPKGWDGRLWIGLINHDVGQSTYLRARIVNFAPPGGKLGAERNKAETLNLLSEHQKEYLTRPPSVGTRIKVPIAKVRSEMTPFVYTFRDEISDDSILTRLKKTVGETKEWPIGGSEFSKLVSMRNSLFRDWEEASRKATAAANTYNGFYNTWLESGSFGHEIGCIVRTVSNLEKVGVADVETGKLVKSAPEPIRISASRHEHEGFQIVLSPIPNCARNVEVRVTDLKSDRGTIPSSRVKINPVGYVRNTPYEAREIITPDPLLIGAIPELKPGENQPVWVSVYVPDDTPAGEYRGNVEIKGRGAKSLKIPLVLTVRNFDIPKKITLRSSFWLFRDQLNRFYHLDRINIDDYLKWVDFTLDYRLCPVDVDEGKSGQLLNIRGADGLPNPNPDFTDWDKFIDRMIAGGASTIHLGQTHHHGAWFADANNPVSSPGQIARVIESIKTLRDHYIKRGVYDLHYMQLRDETSAPESLNVYKEVSKQMPDVKLLLTVPSGDARPFLKIPCPLTPRFNGGWRDDVKANGGEYWWYVCLGPRDPYANFLTYQTAAQHRALFWQTWKFEVQGLLYWALNFWSGYNYVWPQNASMPVDRLPAKDAPRYDNNPRWPGDGVLMYPGPSPSEPMSSIRLEIIRDGEEDFEYLVLLDKLISEAEAKGDNSPALRDARAARAAAKRLVPDLTNHEKSPQPYLEVRERVAKAIEGLMN